MEVDDFAGVGLAHPHIVNVVDGAAGGNLGQRGLDGGDALGRGVDAVRQLRVVFIFDLPTHLSRLPLAFALEFYYLILVHSISFVIAASAFYLNKSYSLTAAKNLALWFFTGELFPLDVMPDPFKSFVIAMPFSSGVFVPVGYITGRLEIGAVWNSFYSITLGIIVINALGFVMWRQGLKAYTGTGA